MKPKIQRALSAIKPGRTAHTQSPRRLAYIDTPLGVFVAEYSDKGLMRLEFPKKDRPARSAPETTSTGQARIMNLASRQNGGDLRHWLNLTRAALEQVCNGVQPSALPPLDLSAGTDFQRAVWAALRLLPPGHTRSYSEIARLVGRPKAARAVGQACGANPIPMLIPCHRILAAHGGLGGFSGGLDWKRRLLDREGAEWRPFHEPFLGALASLPAP